jgi:UDP-glucose 4-epimerase
MTKVFITGANGFVGTHLQKLLQEKNISFISGTRSLYGDISIQKNWADFLQDCDTVVHLAARVHVMHEIENDPLIAFRKYNVEATLNLARSAKASGIKRFIFVSSVKVNGEETPDRPFTAHDAPAPQDPYGESKAEAEAELLKLHESGVFEVVIIRPPLIYGPGVKANFESLMKLVKKNLPLPFGQVKNKRSFVSVYNLADLIVTCLTHPAAGGKIFLVSDDRDLSLAELIKKMASIQNKSARLLPVPVALMKFGASLLGKKAYANRLFGNLQVDISETKKILNWRPPFSFEDSFKY